MGEAAIGSNGEKLLEGNQKGNQKGNQNQNQNQN
jgi:hypothetical protein